MKKLMTVLLIAILCFTCFISAYAASGNSETAERIRFIPTIITVTSSKVTVEGYFANLNTDVSVKNFRDFSLSVYKEGDLIIEGDFGTINSFEIKPLGLKYQSFTFSGGGDLYGLNNGTYVCGDSFYATTGFTFTYRQ